MSGFSKDPGRRAKLDNVKVLEKDERFNSREMSSAKWEVVFLFTAINMLDGHDVSVMSFAAAFSPFDYLIFALTLPLTSR